MSHIELGTPVPRIKDLPYEQPHLVTVDRSYLPVPKELPSRPFWDVLSGRRSRREFGQVSNDQLSALLWHSMKTKERKASSMLGWESRPAPSAGGIHPIDVLVIDRPRLKPRLRLYDPMSHSLALMKEYDSGSSAYLLKVINDIVPIGDGTVIWFIAQFGRTMARYKHGESLVWRDSGALLSVIYLVAEALGLGCCGIGITGDPMISETLCDERFRGVGGCLFGTRLPQ